MTGVTQWSKDEIQARVNAVQWFHDWEIVPGVRTNGSSSMDRADCFKIPEDLTGKRVLDVGCSDGFFTFLAESRGAQVVAIDIWPRQAFFVAREILGSQAEFHHMSVYDVCPERLGFFDIVFVFGVYYHLRNPILALERVASVTREWALFESEVMMPGADLAEPSAVEREQVAVNYFMEHDEYCNDLSNWWIPNIPCFVQTIRAAGFPRASVVSCYGGGRCVVKAEKGPQTAGKPLAEDIFIVIEQPAKGSQVAGTIELAGWVTSQFFGAAGVQGVHVYLDHLDDPEFELGQADYGIQRPDVAVHFGNDHLLCGFRFQWDSSVAAPGPHTLHLMVESSSGWSGRPLPLVITRDLPCQVGEAVPAGQEQGTGKPVIAGRAAEPTLATLADEVEAHSDVAMRDYVVRSHVPMVGRLIAWVRRTTTSHLREPYLDPIIERQVGLNQQVAGWLKRASQLLSTMARRQSELQARVESLEARNADFRARLSRLERTK